MRHPILRHAFAIAPILLSTFLSFSSAAQTVPQQLQPHGNEQLVFRVQGKGYQIYTCKMDGAQFMWVLKAPEAQLFAEDGKLFGTHFSGPSWQANDGSRITGKAVANAPSPDPDSIPWLLINVVSHEGNGVLSRITTVQRLNTKGGKAPASGCDSAHASQEVRVPYSAEYLFHAPK
jgi:Protein of unknown function (DUF3455)